MILSPAGVSVAAPDRGAADSALVKAVARAHRWRRMLESGAFASVAELAAAERINPSYLARVLRLTLLAPDIVEAMLEGKQGDASMKLDSLMKGFSTEWPAQRTTRP